MHTLAGRRDALRLGLAAALAMLLPGCVPIYIPRSSRYGRYRGPIPREALAFLAAGTTTRTEVLLRLGLPDEVQDDDRRLVYYWYVETGHVGFVGLWTGPGWARVEQHRLLLEFEETGVLREHEHRVTANWFVDPRIFRRGWYRLPGP